MGVTAELEDPPDVPAELGGPPDVPAELEDPPGVPAEVPCGGIDSRTATAIWSFTMARMPFTRAKAAASGPGEEGGTPPLGPGAAVEVTTLEADAVVGSVLAGVSSIVVQSAQRESEVTEKVTRQFTDNSRNAAHTHTSSWPS